MKQLKFLWIGFIFIQSFAPSGLCAPGIQGSAHDFSGKSWSQGEMCQACHTPHHANNAEVNAPLWNHAYTQQNFTPYTSSTLKANVGQPDGISKLCLSCHDGTIALDAYGGFGGETDSAGKLVNKIGNQIGPDLNSNLGHSLVHPISFVYDSKLSDADDRLNDPSQPQTALNGATVKSSLLVNDQVQCSSCHDVHNKQGIDKLLRLPLENNTLCIACHKGM